MTATIPLTAPETELMAMSLIDVLDNNPDVEYTNDQLLAAAGYDPTTYYIPRRVRSMFQGVLAKTGMFVPPSVPVKGFRIFATRNPEKLLEPLLHIGQIGLGINKLMLRITDYMVNSKAGKDWAVLNPQAAFAITLVHQSYSFAVQNSESMTTQVSALVSARP